MRYGSVCSGIEAATVAWHPLGWAPAFFSEIEKFPSAVLAHHYPRVPNLGDMTKFQEWPDADIDVLVGGTPCQSFSVAGLRAGLADPRGNLMLTYLAIAAKYQPRWLVWENVPGVLSSDGGRDFGTFLRGLGECGYGFAYRVLDAQYCRASGLEYAVPQRRRRVFVIGHIGDWRRAAAVLFDGQSLRGDPAPRREAGQGPAKPTPVSFAGGRLVGGVDYENNGHGPEDATGPLLKGSPSGGGRPLPAVAFASTGNVAHCLNAGGMGRQDYETETMIAHTLRGEGFDSSEDGTGRGTPLVPVQQPIVMMERGRGDGPNLETRQDGTANAILTPNGGRGGLGVGAVAIQERAVSENPLSGPDGAGVRDDGASYTLEARSVTQAVAYGLATSVTPKFGVDVSPTLTVPSPTGGGQPAAVATDWAVRRLTPLECERLQGFPEILDRVRIEVWHSSDLRQTDAFAATPSHKSQKPVSIAGESASMPHAKPVAGHSSTSRQGRDLPVVLSVLINLERGEVQISRAGKLIWSASTAAKPSASPLSMPTDAFVRLAALMTQTAVPHTLTGRVASPAPINSSSQAWIGSALVSVSGQEIGELASDAAKFTTALNDSTKCTTSPSGPDTQSLGSIQRTLSCCVMAAISSCIPSEIRAANSYAVSVEVVRGFTQVPYRNKPAADGPRYKALGNSMAVNVMRILGERIAMVDQMEVAA